MWRLLPDRTSTVSTCWRKPRDRSVHPIKQNVQVMLSLLRLEEKLWSLTLLSKRRGSRVRLLSQNRGRSPESSLVSIRGFVCYITILTYIYLSETPQPSNSPGHASVPSTSQADRLPSGSPPLGETSLTPDPGANSRQSQLSMIAASASEMVPQGMSMDQDSPMDGLPRLSGSWGPSHEQLLFESLQEHDPSLTAATQRAASYPRPIAMNPNSQAKGFVNDFGNSTKPSKPKVRGRFSAARRREVQEVRKRGACIRCRMLKKPVRFILS